MDDRTTQIIRELNRLANDNSLPPKVRLKMNAVAQHIKELQAEIRIEGLDIVLES